MPSPLTRPTALRFIARIALITFAAALMPVVKAAHAQNFPAKPMRIVVPFSPGGGTDTMARVLAQKMSEHWGQPVLVENRTGAAGALGTALVAKATPDGYTLLVSSPSFVIAAALYANLPYDALKDFAGVTQIGTSTSVLMVTPTAGVKTVKEFVEFARARPGKIFFSSAGAGTSTHLSGERFRLAAGINVVHVGFKGSSDALLEVVAGRVHYMVTGLIPAQAHIKEGRVLALGVVTPTRSPLLPDVPALAEIFPGYRRDGSHMLLAPAGTPRAIINQISREARRILELPDVKERMKSYDYNLLPTTPEEMDKILRVDIATFAELIKQAGLRPR